MPDKIRGNMLILDPDSPLIAEGVYLPTVEPHTYVLLDDDAQECRVISEDELDWSYVDNNIESYQLQEVNWLTLEVDKEYVTITYSNGVPLVWISEQLANRTTQVGLNAEFDTVALHGKIVEVRENEAIIEASGERMLCPIGKPFSEATVVVAVP